METTIKELLKTAEIRTMKKDILLLKGAGVFKNSTKKLDENVNIKTAKESVSNKITINNTLSQKEIKKSAEPRTIQASPSQENSTPTTLGFFRKQEIASAKAPEEKINLEHQKKVEINLQPERISIKEQPKKTFLEKAQPSTTPYTQVNKNRIIIKETSTIEQKPIERGVPITNQKPPLKKEYLNETPLMAKEKPAELPKIETLKKKKFIDEIEEWINSSNKPKE